MGGSAQALSLELRTEDVPIKIQRVVHAAHQEQDVFDSLESKRPPRRSVPHERKFQAGVIRPPMTGPTFSLAAIPMMLTSSCGAPAASFDNHSLRLCYIATVVQEGVDAALKPSP